MSQAMPEPRSIGPLTEALIANSGDSTPTFRQRIGARAREDIARRFAPALIGERYRSRLEGIRRHVGGRADPQALRHPGDAGFRRVSIMVVRRNFEELYRWEEDPWSIGNAEAER